MAFDNPSTCAAFGQESSDPNYSLYFGYIEAVIPPSQNITLQFDYAADPVFSNTSMIGFPGLIHSEFGLFQHQLIDTTAVPWTGEDQWHSNTPGDQGAWDGFSDPNPGLRSDVPGAAYTLPLFNDGAQHTYKLTMEYQSVFHYGPDSSGTDADLYLWDFAQWLDGDMAVLHGNMILDWVVHGASPSGNNIGTIWLASSFGWVDNLSITYDGGGGGTISQDFESGVFTPFTQVVEGEPGLNAFVIACPPFGGGGRPPRAGCTRCGSGLMGMAMRRS